VGVLSVKISEGPNPQKTNADEATATKKDGQYSTDSFLQFEMRLRTEARASNRESSGVDIEHHVGIPVGNRGIGNGLNCERSALWLCQICRITFEYRCSAETAWLVPGGVTASVEISCQLVLTDILTRPSVWRAEAIGVMCA